MPRRIKFMTDGGYTAHVLLEGENQSDCAWDIVSKALNEDWMLHLSFWTTELEHRGRFGIYVYEDDSYELFLGIDESDLANLPPELLNLFEVDGWFEYPMEQPNVASWSTTRVPGDAFALKEKLLAVLSCFTCRGFLPIRFPDALKEVKDAGHEV